MSKLNSNGKNDTIGNECLNISCQFLFLTKLRQQGTPFSCQNANRNTVEIIWNN